MEPNKNEEKPHGIEDLDQRLYSRNFDTNQSKQYSTLHQKRYSVRKEWASPAAATDTIMKTVKHPSFFKRFFHFSLGFAGLALVIALIVFFTGTNTVSNKNININILGNSFTAGGEELELEIEIVNKNPTNLELADLFVEYDKGGDTVGRAREVNSIGTVPSGKTTRKKIFVTLYGEEGATKNVDVTLQYRIRGSNAVFVKKETFPVTISSAPVALSVEAPENISPNQQVTLTIKAQSNSKNTLEGMLLRMDYPSGFRYEKSTPETSAFNNVWDLGDLAPGATKEIQVTGTVFGQDGEDRAFHVYIGSASTDNNTKIGIAYNSMLHVVSLVKPFLAANLRINGSDEATVPVPSAGSVNVSINWANNLETPIRDAEISVAISGNAYKNDSVKARTGFYDSVRKTIIWNKTTAPELASIDPSDSGGLDFSFDVAPLWQSGQSVVSKPQVKLTVSIKGKQTSDGGSIIEITNFEEKTAIVSSDLGFSANAYYTSGPFSNTGPIPPKVGQPTTYTVTWTVTNSANALSDGIAISTLPTYVEWVGTVSPSTEKVEYDQTTRTVRWRIGSVKAGTGPGSSSRTASFQLRFNPSSSQIGTAPDIILDTSVSARDTYTNEMLSTSRESLDTRLDNDAGFPLGGETVTQ